MTINLGEYISDQNEVVPISALTSLTGVLDLRNNQITDIAPLSALTSLTVLDLDERGPNVSAIKKLR
eukprot:SAG22_NODE_243_length_14055_cov_3.073015_4_plen_67_part_00